MFIKAKGEFITKKGETIVRIKRLKNIITNVFITPPISETFTSHLKKLKFFHCFPGSFPSLRIFKIDVSISFTDLLQAVVKNDNMAGCFSCSAW